MLYGVVGGLAIGLIAGGRASRLAEIRVRWARVAIVGLLVQIVLFSEPVAARVGDLGPALYLASTVAVLAVVLRNLAIPGLALVALGAVSNLAAIIANGGFMPTTEAALRAAGDALHGDYSNSRVVADPALAPLTDIFALPAWVPLSNVFSVGDIVIATGVMVAIVWAMRNERLDPAPGVAIADARRDVPERDVPVPDVPVPDVSVPDVPVPDVSVPDVPVPDVSVPDVSIAAVRAGPAAKTRGSGADRREPR